MRKQFLYMKTSLKVHCGEISLRMTQKLLLTISFKYFVIPGIWPFLSLKSNQKYLVLFRVLGCPKVY